MSQDKLYIQRFVNHPIDSNCFVIYTEAAKTCIIIDPGTEDCIELLNFFSEHQLEPELIILTHEHFDHIWGVNTLKEHYPVKVACSKRCSDAIMDKKKNMSVFHNQIGFEIKPADIIVANNDSIIWNNHPVHFIETRGHTTACMCVEIGQYLFSGDTIIKGYKTITKLPGGSKQELNSSLDLIFNKYKNTAIEVFPGHGDNFRLNEIRREELL